MSGSGKGYVAPPSVGHELGVLFGFVAVFLIVFVTYFIAYRIRNERFERGESERVRALKAKGAIPNEKQEAADLAESSPKEEGMEEVFE